MRGNRWLATVTPETPWHAGRLRQTSGLPRLLFGRMYEDAQIERAAFQNKHRVFCIASAGCTALQLSERHAVVACDINPLQLAYAERRARGGATEIGEAERLMSFARLFMPLAGWRRKFISDFLALSDVTDQAAFWRERLDTRRFRAGLDVFMSPALLRVAYSPRFLSFLPGNFGAVLRKRLQKGFARHSNATNPYARTLLLGESKEEPPTKKPDIQFVLADAAAHLESCAPGSFDAFALSNILDGADSSYRDRLSRAVRGAAAQDAVVVLRSFAEPSPQLARNHAECDRTMLWGIVDVCRASSF